MKNVIYISALSTGGARTPLKFWKVFKFKIDDDDELLSRKKELLADTEHV